MTDEKTWDELSDYYAGHTPEIIREIQVPDRALTADDLDDIFAGRPLADQPRPKADILAKTYLTKEIETEEQIAALEQAGVKVVVSSAQDIAGVYTAITLLGQLVDKNDEAAALIADMKAAFADVAEKAAAANVSGKTVYFEISPLPYGIWSAGQGTFMDELAKFLNNK
mgnify:CR=1 FL=1